jgi:hypothetical protein
MERYAPAYESGAAAVLSKQEPVAVLLKAIRQADAMTHGSAPWLPAQPKGRTRGSPRNNLLHTIDRLDCFGLRRLFFGRRLQLNVGEALRPFAIDPGNACLLGGGC